MIYVKSFKGYEDKLHELDGTVNAWMKQAGVEAVDVKTALSHENGSRAGSGDLIYTVLYRAENPVA